MSPPDRPATPDDAVVRLVQLARARTTPDSVPESRAGLRRLEHRLHEISLRRRVPSWLRYTAAMAGIVGTAAIAVLAWRDRALTFEVMNAAVGDGGYVAAGSADAAVRFSDHSELGVEHGSRLRVSHLEARGANVMLEGGLLHVRINPRPRATWTLDAGPYVVHVTGTEFDLAWRANDQTLDLRLIKGSVTVDGPLAGGGLRMAAGQHLIANALDRSLSIVNAQAERSASAIDAATARPVVAGPAIAAIAPLQAGSSPPAGQRVQAAPAARSEQGWATRVARGDFAGIMQDAERHGLDRALAESSSVDLAALADAARYGRRPDLARRALSATRTRFPGSVHARDAAFFLGGLAEADTDDASAVDWYGVYMRESQDGAYASQALGRRMILLQRTGNEAAAQQAAAEYTRRFGGEAYAPAAQKILHAP